MVIRCSNGIVIDREKNTISHLGEIQAFVRTKRNIRFKALCFLILGPGVSLEQLFFRIYGDDPDGGPDDGPHYFLICLRQWEKEFMERLGVEWRSWRISGVNFYCVVPEHQLPDPKHRSVYRNLRRRTRMEQRGSA